MSAEEDVMQPPFISNDWTLLEGDCMRLMGEFDNETFDSVITDPPYGLGYQSSHRNQIPKFEDIANDNEGRPFIWWLYDAYRVMKEGGGLICFTAWQYQEAFRQAIVWAGFSVRSHVIWDRGNHGMGDLNGQFGPMHDVIWYATKGKGRLYGTRPLSVIPAMRPTGQALTHPTEKPVNLMRYLVRAVVPPGGILLDPFAGTGATGVAALLENRTPVLIEMNQEYCVKARKRLAISQITFDMEGV